MGKPPVVVDSSFLIALEQETATGSPGPAHQYLPKLRGRKLVLSVVTVEELLEGAADEGTALKFLTRFTIQPLGLAHARRCAQNQYRSARRMGENDAWIVATADLLGADILGADRKAFERLESRYLRFQEQPVPAKPPSFPLFPLVNPPPVLPVVAAIVTHRRPAELARLLRGLSESAVPLAGCVISDHAPGGETKSLAGQTRFPTIVLDDPSNPGPGAGWAKAAKAALTHFPEAAAIWYLDDDVVIPPDALGTLLEEMARAGADSIAPLLTGTDGKLWAFPEPESPAWRGPIREAATPAEARAALGDAPVSFCWCTGACYLVKKTAIEKSGFHREDFWLLGEDLEYSMRLAGASRAVFTCKVSVPHLPPPAASPAAARKSDYVKFCSLLQNLTYLAFHAPHSRHMKRYLPGNYRRFFRTHALRSEACPESGVSRGGAEGRVPSKQDGTEGPVPSRFRRILHVSCDAAACWWNGAVRGQPAGAVSGQALRQRISRYEF